MNDEPADRSLLELNVNLTGRDPLEVVAWAVDRYGDGLVLACSFSVEDAVVVHLLAQCTARPQVFALDTGRLPEETYQAAEALRVRYGLAIDWYSPDTAAVEALMRAKGAHSFRCSLQDRHECCRVRKVEPLQRALAGRAAWLTGLRRTQSVTRAGLSLVEVDELHGGIAKISPLRDWSAEQVWAFARAYEVPVHPLHQKGYPSIGCAPCTRAVRAGEPERAGRWWWELPEHKECGLHPARLRDRGTIAKDATI